MAERAVITVLNDKYMSPNDLAMYTQHCGGRDCIEAYLAYCKLKGYAPPEKDEKSLFLLREVMRNHIYGTLEESGESEEDYEHHLPVEALSLCMFDAYWDEGLYVIKDWRIVRRIVEDTNKMAGELLRYDLIDMLLEIDSSQPEDIQLGEKQIRSKLRKLYWQGYRAKRTWLQKLIKELKVRRYERWKNEQYRKFLEQYWAEQRNNPNS